MSTRHAVTSPRRSAATLLMAAVALPAVLTAQGGVCEESPRAKALCDAVDTISPDRCSSLPGEVEACLSFVAGEDGIPSVGETVIFCGNKSRGEPNDWCWRFGQDDPDEGCACQGVEFPTFRYPRRADAGVDPAQFPPVKVVLEVRKDEGIALQIAGVECERIPVCELTSPRSAIVVGPDGGEVLVPVQASDPRCQWRVTESSGFPIEVLDPRNRRGQGNQDLWVRVAGLSGLGCEDGSLDPEGGGEAISIQSDDGTPLRIGVERLALRTVTVPVDEEIVAAYVPCPGACDCSGAVGTPVLMLSDGPGITARESVRDGRLDLIRNVVGERPIILVESRGSVRGADAARLNCQPESLELEPDETLTAQGLLAIANAGAESCRTRLTKEKGVVFSEYRTQDSVDDLEAIRLDLEARGLEAQSVILWAEGYGTKVALGYLKKYGGRVERAVLHGPKPLRQTVAEPRRFTEVLQKIDAESEGDLLGQIAEARRLLKESAVPFQEVAEQPVLFTKRRSARQRTTQPVPVTLGEVDLQQAVAYRVLDRRHIQSLPRDVAAMAEDGDFDPIARSITSQVRTSESGDPVDPCDPAGGPAVQARRVAARGECLGSALSYVTDCALRGRGEVRAKDEDERKLARRAHRFPYDFPYPEVCSSGWQVTPNRVFRRCRGDDCPESTIPVLLVSAELDPLSSPEEVRKVSTFLRRQAGAGVSTLMMTNAARSDLFDPRVVDRLREFVRGDLTGALQEVELLPLFEDESEPPSIEPPFCRDAE